MNKKTTVVAAAAILLASAFGTVSCGSSDKESKADAKPAKKVEKAEDLPNYRYVDLDTLLAKYNLAKDYNEEIMRMQSNMEQEVKRHENSINQLAGQMQNKMQNNTYLSRESYEADQQKLNSMQANAQKSVGTLQQNFAQKAQKAQETVNDSITAYIERYNKKHGYDAIFFKAAALHFNPALDITQEIVEGLNAQYNKVKK